MKNAIRSCFVSLSLFALASSMPASASAQGRIEGAFDRTLNVSGPVNLEVSTGSGSIDIRRGSSDRVEIRGRIRAGDSWWRSSRDAEDVVRRLEANPPVEQSGQTIRVGQFLNRDDAQNVSISYEILLPAQSSVRASTGSGRQTVEGIDGRVEARAGSGTITLRDIRGDLDANAGSGTIRVTNLLGGLRIHTGSGEIQVQGEQAGRWEFQTGSGDLDIDLPPNASFELSAHTGSGDIEVAYPMTVQGRIGNRHDVAGRVGNGGPALNARTGSGDIRIQ